MQIKSRKDFVSGLMFFALGAAFSLGAFSYNVGSAARMGPGYFPALLGGLLAVLGLVVAASALGRPRPDGSIGRFAWRPLLYIIGANLAFGVLLGGIPSLGVPAMGLIVATLAAVVIARMAGERFRWAGAVALAAVLTIGSYLVFVLGLNLQFQVWPTFIAG